MKTIRPKQNQTIFDIALEQYGTCEAIGEIMGNNPALFNDPAALSALGINAAGNRAFYIDAAVSEDCIVLIDTDSPLIQSSVIKNIETDITTFNL